MRSCGFEVLGQWSKLDQAVSALGEAPPDVLILSRRIVDQACKSKIGQLRQQIATIIVLEPEDALDAEDLREFSFEGLLISDAPGRVVESCLRTVAAGHAWIDPTFLRFRASQAQGHDWRCLSDRELEVAHLAATGLSNKRIAKTLRVSDGTVKMHMHHILSKLQLERRGDLVVALMRGGVMPRTGSRAAALVGEVTSKVEAILGSRGHMAGRNKPAKSGAFHEQWRESAGERVNSLPVRSDVRSDKH